jgi:two-component system, OmpR family, KDP operon response regulator KdpE
MGEPRVLVVDDEVQMQRVLHSALVAHGYQVEVAEDGEAALRTIAAHPPDMIVLDLVLPGIDGAEVLRQTRTWSAVPIVVLSAHGQECTKVEALDLGADDYLTKPFGMEELLARLRAVMRRAVLPAKPVIQAGDVVIDLARRIITRRGGEIHLTPTEYNVLRVLATDVDRVITHRQLLKRAWGTYAAENSPQLRVYINYLRRKLESDPTHPQVIVTEPGVGYRLKADPSPLVEAKL